MFSANCNLISKEVLELIHVLLFFTEEYTCIDHIKKASPISSPPNNPFLTH